MGIYLKKTIRIRQRLAELKYELAQVITRLRFGGVRPEEEGDLLADLGGIGMKYEECKE